MKLFSALAPFLLLAALGYALNDGTSVTHPSDTDSYFYQAIHK